MYCSVKHVLCSIKCKQHLILLSSLKITGRLTFVDNYSNDKLNLVNGEDVSSGFSREFHSRERPQRPG